MTEERQINAAMGLIHADYRVQKYRLLYWDPAFLAMQFVSDMPSPDLTLLPSAPVENRAGGPKNGPRVRKRIGSNGEFTTSTKHNMPMSAAYGLHDSSILPSSQASQASQLEGVSSQPAVISLL